MRGARIEIWLRVYHAKMNRVKSPRSRAHESPARPGLRPSVVGNFSRARISLLHALYDWPSTRAIFSIALSFATMSSLEMREARVLRQKGEGADEYGAGFSIDGARHET